MQHIIRLRTSNYNKNVLFHYFLISLFIISHGTWFYSINDMLFRYTIIVVSICSFAFIKRTREKRLLFYLIFTLAMAFICEIVFANSINLNIMWNNYLHFIEVILITIVAYNYNRDNFYSRYVKLVIILAVTSLIFYIISNVDETILISNNILKKVEMNRLTYTNFYCNFWYAFRDREVQRNVGMFTEPGLYQIIINSAIYILVFYYNRTNIKHRHLTMALLVVCLLTTQSATGYMGLLIIIFGIIFTNNIINKNLKRMIWLAIGGAIMFLGYDVYKNKQQSYIYQLLIEKLLGIGSENATTGSVRLETITGVGELIIKNPFGYGYSYTIDYMNSDNIDGIGARILISMAAVGVIPVCLILFNYLKRAYKNRLNNIQYYVLILLFINTSLAQARDFYPALFVLMLFEAKKMNSTQLEVQTSEKGEYQL